MIRKSCPNFSVNLEREKSVFFSTRKFMKQVQRKGHIACVGLASSLSNKKKQNKRTAEVKR